MKKKILLILCLTLLLSGCGRSENTPSSRNPVSSVSESSSSDAGSTTSDESDGQAANTTAEGKAPVLTELTVAEPNNIGKKGYLEIELVNNQKRVDVYREAMESRNLTLFLRDGSPVITGTGHKVYVDAEGNQYAISGVDVIPVRASVPDYTMPVKLRKEETAERVRVFGDKDEYETAVKNYEVGQKILEGKMEVPENCVILNGVYLPDVHFETDENGVISMSLLQLAQADDDNSGLFEFEGWVSVAVNFRNVDIPTDVAIDGVKDFFQVEEDIITGKPATWVYTDYGVDSWSDTFLLPKTAQAIMPIEDISRIFGWRFYVGDGIISVVTDELDNNNNFVYQKVVSYQETYPLPTPNGDSPAADG